MQERRLRSQEVSPPDFPSTFQVYGQDLQVNNPLIEVYDADNSFDFCGDFM